MQVKSYVVGVMLAAGLLMGCGGVEATADEAAQAQAEAQAEVQSKAQGLQTVSVSVGDASVGPVRCFVCACDDSGCACVEVVCPE